MDNKKPQVSNLSTYNARENAQKSLNLLLNYSKNAKKNKDYVAQPQSMLKDDLKREFGCKSDNADKKCKSMSRHFTEEEHSGSIPSINSIEINEFIDKYICNDNVNQSSNTNIITLNPDEFVRMKAGGSILSKQRNRPFNITENSKTKNVEETKESKSQNMSSEKTINKAVRDENDNVANEKLIRMKVPVFQGPCCKDKQMQLKIMSENKIAMEKEQSLFKKSMMDSAIEKFDKQLEKIVTNRKDIVSESHASKFSEGGEKHISFAHPIQDDSSSEVSSEDTTVNQDEVSQDNTPYRPTRSKLTIVEFDRIFNEELKKRRTKTFSKEANHSTRNTNHCAMDHIRLEPTSSVKASLIHSVVTGLPHDIPFTEDYDLMNAIDKFIQAENACKFEEALRAAEIAAKLAPPGYEEEAAASAARNYQFYCNNQDNFHSIPLDRKKKPIEIVAYVGSTQNK